MAKSAPHARSGFPLPALGPTGKKRSAVFLALLTLFGLYCLALGVAAPYFGKPFLEKELSQGLGANCSIDRLTIHPLTWKATASGVTIPYPASRVDLQDKDFIRLKRLEMSFSPASFKDFALVVDDLRLIEPHIDMTLYKDGTLSPQFLFPRADNAPPTQPDANTANNDVFPLIARNMTMRSGTLTLRDEISNAVYIATDIDIALPFASTLASDKDTALTPSLSAVINGKPLSITGESRPFAETARTEFTLRTRDMGLLEFRGFIAPYTNLALKSGSLQTELTLRFDAEPDKPLSVSLAGSVAIADLALAGPDGEVFAVDRAGIDVENVLFGPRRATVTDFFLENPKLVIRRQKNGSIDWTGFFFLPDNTTASDVRLASGHGDPLPQPQTAAKKTTPDTGLPLLLAVAKARVTSGSVSWHDAAASKPVAYTLDNIDLAFSDVSTEAQGRAHFSLTGGKGKQKISATGKATVAPLALEADVSIRDVPLAPFAGYIPKEQGITLQDGVAGVAGKIALEYAANKNVRISNGSAYVANVRIHDAKRLTTPLAKVQHLEITSVSMDLAARSFRVGALSGKGLNADLLRDATGSLVVPSSAKGSSPNAARAMRDAPAPKPWRVDVDSLAIQKSSFSLVDASLKHTARLPFTDVSFNGKNFANHDNKQWSMTVSGKPGERGSLKLSAKGVLAPLDLTFSGAMDKADMRPFSPYLQEIGNLELSEATMGGDFSGSIKRVPGSVRGAHFSVNGNLGLYGITLAHGKQEFGGWGRMRIEDIAYRAPAKGGRMLSVGSVVVNNPRMLVSFDEHGVSSIDKALPFLTAPQERPKNNEGQQLPLTSLRIGSITVAQGQASYYDKRVAPPYALRVEQINTSIKNLALDPKEIATVTASLIINGSPVNATGQISSFFSLPQGKGTIHIQALDLSRYTQYAEKYLGYPVQRGEMDAYVEASLNKKTLGMHNQIVIRNLDLGAKTPSAHAPDLPLPATVTLLRDMNGDIHLNLPVSGTLGDPEFKLGGIVRQVIGNIALKTVTAPFTLIGGIFSGIGSIFSSNEPQSAEIDFSLGSSALRRGSAEALTAVGAELLKSKNAVLEITGMADQAEKDTLIDAWLEKSLRMMKYNSLPPEQKTKTTPEKVIVSPQYNAKEYSALLFALYKKMPFVKNSRDAAITSPQSTRAIMRILRSRAEIGDNELTLLAESRARSVYHAVCKGKIDIAARLRILPPLLDDTRTSGSRAASRVKIRVAR